MAYVDGEKVHACSGNCWRKMAVPECDGQPIILLWMPSANQSSIHAWND